MTSPSPHVGFVPTRCAAGVLLALATGFATAATPTYAPWLTQIGLNNTVASTANWGYGQLLGLVDTGINATHPEFAPGQVSQASSACAAVSFTCSRGFADDNSHGTAVASIAAGNRVWQNGTASGGGYTTVAGNFIGVAPLANIVAEKVLNAAGSGYSTDVANGVRRAADAGATVINVSITYGNDANTVAAINYAAAKGAFIVWAGGNSSQNLLNNLSTSGLTPVAIQHLIFAGSVNSGNALSSFSNKPGSGSLQGSGASASYASRWIMAPGEAILAPYNSGGSNAYSLWSGTSMAAPIVSGSLMLLQNAWPILKTQGTTANLLLATGKNLGSAGTDATYGNGLVNLQAAFSPYGGLSITKANGQNIALSSLSGSLISSGALGSLSSIQAKLANYTVFDSYTRNFTVNLSGLIKSPGSSASLNPLPSNSYSAPKVMKYAGGELAYSLQNVSVPQFGRSNLSDSSSQMVGYALFTNKADSVTAIGYGASSSYPFAKALYNDDLSARQMADFDSSSMSSLAQGGYQLSYGTKLSPALRLATSYSSTARSNTPAELTLTPAPQSNQLKVGIAYQFSPRLSGGITYSKVSEQNSLLGATYSNNSILSFGQNASNVTGLSLGYRLNANSSVVFNTEAAHTRAGNGNSLLSETSAIQSRAYGMTYLQQNLWKPDDQLLASIKQPLRVTSGSAALTTASVDAQGNPVFEKSWSSLSPDGREIDYTLSYQMPTGKRSQLTMQAVYQKDAQNIAGNKTAVVGMLWNSRF